MTKSQINKLGEKLRTASELGAETLSQLQQFRASYDEPMFRAQTLLGEVGFEATSRLKTINTIIEKLRRERTRLAEMQDIGGLRIVSEVDLTGQDTIVSRIVDIFPVARVIDRRKSPNHGYRAVHVIATLGERRIEIQVRTQLQDLWAQAMERLADEAGREIRYGGTPQARSEDVESLLNSRHRNCTDRGYGTKLNQMETGCPSQIARTSDATRAAIASGEIQSFRLAYDEHEEDDSRLY